MLIVAATILLADLAADRDNTAVSLQTCGVWTRCQFSTPRRLRCTRYLHNTRVTGIL
jgi:hypothetical protein